MAKINIIIPEPTDQYSEDNQRQIAQALRTLADQLNTTFQVDQAEEDQAFTWFNN
jgi:hypothetical protein|tara:strand:+ start:2972 stop:3136 length:165 start_codon:yes stop_codon:yes gene_type:complete